MVFQPFFFRTPGTAVTATVPWPGLGLPATAMACAAMRTAAGEGDDLMKEISVFLFPKNSLTDCG